MEDVPMASGAKRAGYLVESYHYFHLYDTAGQERSFHYHDFDKLVILLSGRVDYIVEDVTYPLQPFDILFVRHHAIHKALIDRTVPYDRVIIYLDRKYYESRERSGELLECFRCTDGPGKCVIHPGDGDIGRIISMLEEFEAEEDDTAFAADALRATVIDRLLLTLSRITKERISQHERRSTIQRAAERSEALSESELERTLESRSPQNRRIVDEKVTEAIKYIDENLCEELTVDALASGAYLSRYHFMRLFKAQTGETVHAYIRQKRLLYAARLIREGMTAGDAAAESGFKDYSTFTRAFKESFGITPVELKNNNGGKNG